MTLAVAALLAAAAAWLAQRPARNRVPGRSVGWRLWRAGVRRVTSRRQRAARRTETRDAMAEVVADVRAGQPPLRALERALGDRDVAPRTLAAVRLGGDVVEALRDDARQTMQPILAGAGACWSVATAQGAGLADALERLVAQDRRAEEVRRQLEAHLAAPRATARMLAMLPALGIALGLLVGGDPIGWLLGTPFGWACLVLGLALVGLGLAWSGRIAARTERLL
jgi:tight adherence protein B